MTLKFRAAAATSALLIALSTSGTAFGQKRGGTLKMYNPASPASMSLLEEATSVAEIPMMGVFNNLILFDQHVKQVSLQSIVPELATGWSWNEDGTELTFPLRQGVKWHDGKPFTSQDVKCTWTFIWRRGLRSCASIPANPLIATSTALPRTAISRSPFT